MLVTLTHAYVQLKRGLLNSNKAPLLNDEGQRIETSQNPKDKFSREPNKMNCHSIEKRECE